MNWLPKSIDLVNSVKNLVNAFGGYLVSQSDSASQVYARHQLRLAQIEAAKEFMIEEVKSVTGIRDSLRKRFLDANPEQRLQLRKELEFSDAELRRLAIYMKAADNLPGFAERISLAGTVGDDVTPDGNETAARDEGTTDHWLDRFNNLARLRLEPWRQDLLARALAAEATVPGIVSHRAIWAIGMLDYAQFQAFTVLLDLSSIVAGGYVIPQSSNSIVIPECELGRDIRLGQLIYQLNDTEILGYRVSHQHVKMGETIVASYRSQRFSIRSDRVNWTINGEGPSVTGRVIAMFY